MGNSRLFSYKQLVSVRLMYLRARDAMHHKHVAHHIAAVILFDWCNESVLRLIIRHFGDNRDLNQRSLREFFNKAQELVKEKTGRVIKAYEIFRIRDIRNSAQHEASPPPVSELKICFESTRDFLHDAISTVWDIAFEDVRLLHLVQSEDACELLEQAEAHFTNGNYDDALPLAAEALERVVRPMDRDLLGEPIPMGARGIILMDHDGDVLSDHDHTRMLDSFRQLRTTVRALALGMNDADFRRYQVLVGPGVWTGAGTYRLQRSTESTTAADARFVIDYCTQAIISLEHKKE